MSDSPSYPAPDAYPPPPPPPPPPASMWRRRWPWIVGGVVVVVLLVIAGIVGASGGDDDTATDRPDSTVTPPGADVDTTEAAETTTTEADETSGVPEAARSYFEAFATEDLSRMGAMLDNSVEGSPAALYAIHQIANIRAIGTSLGTSMVVGDETIALKSTTGYDANGADQTETATYGGFTVEGGKLTGFNINDIPVADRIRPSGDPVTVDGVTVRVVTAYNTARGDLTLNVDTTNGRQGVLNVSSYEWALVTPDGRQVGLSQNFCCPTDPVIQPGATAGYVAAFEQVGLGGTLRFVAFADDFVTEVRFDVAVPA